MTYLDCNQGIFSSVLKDMKGTKAAHGPEMEAEDAKGAEALSTIFTVVNFPLDVENTDKQITDDTDEVELLDIGIPRIIIIFFLFNINKTVKEWNWSKHLH